MRGLLLLMAGIIAASGNVKAFEFNFRGLDESLMISTAAEEILIAANKNNKMANLTTPEIIRSHGYEAEIHHVTTEDGYILELHRIPHGKNEIKKKRPVAFLHHCLLCSSSDFIMNTPDKALAFMLADAGYDVWLANARGNTYSKNHVSLSPEDEEFWEFSWHEMGYYDLPAAIDHILSETGEKDINYIGFSMGTTVFWVLMSERPEYAAKIKFMGAMGPVAYVENMEGPLKYLSWFSTGLMHTLKYLGRHEIFSFGPAMDYLVSFFCDEERFTAAICHNSLFLITGSNPDQLNKEYLPVILSHTPAGTSSRTLLHYLQEVRSGKFQKYDFGGQTNQDMYGTFEPPSYNLSYATPPVALFWSKNDWLASPKDVLQVLSELPNVVHVKGIEDPRFTHLDFIWAIDADDLVYQPLMETMALYQQEKENVVPGVVVFN